MIRGMLVSVRVSDGVIEVQVPDEMGGVRQPRESGVLDVKAAGHGEPGESVPTPEDIFDSIFEGCEAWGSRYASFFGDDSGLDSENRSR